MQLYRNWLRRAVGEVMDGQPLDSDKSLIKRFRSGDEDAALHLYLRYAERLMKIARKETPADLSTRFDPEDIVQSVFRTFFRRAAGGQYEAPEGDELWKLLLVMALNKVRARGAFHRASKRDIRKTQALPPAEVPNNSMTDEEVAREVLRLSLEEVIANQPESHRDIIRLRIDGFEVQAIADQLQRSKRTVERVLQSFREQLLQAALVCESDD